MEAFIPLLCLMAYTALIWVWVWRRGSGTRPVKWTWRLTGAVMLGVVGAIAVPVLVAVAIQNS